MVNSEVGMMEQLTALDNQQAFWKVYHRNPLTCAVDFVKPQLMRCVISHPSERESLGLRITRCRKGVVLLNKEHATSVMKKTRTSLASTSFQQVQSITQFL
uniref:Uncharacterized protein n=1 Tax=Physcomitrium patens TaxID=3218 RepID=A0A2K1KAV1_PHYPA|nr:hypothetical protein PHYPA_010091 [Physcomitrium patens]